MFRITRDPPSGSSIQCMVKITVMVLSCPLIWTWAVLWQDICPWCVCVLHSVEKHCVYLTRQGPLYPREPPITLPWVTLPISRTLSIPVSSPSIYSPGRLWGFQEVEGPSISRQSAHEGGKAVSPTHRPRLHPVRYTCYSFLVKAESTPGP